MYRDEIFIYRGCEVREMGDCARKGLAIEWDKLILFRYALIIFINSTILFSSISFKVFFQDEPWYLSAHQKAQFVFLSILFLRNPNSHDLLMLRYSISYY
jgi:hypothetical protein